jgi:hypothetical protein
MLRSVRTVSPSVIYSFHEIIRSDRLRKFYRRSYRKNSVKYGTNRDSAVGIATGYGLDDRDKSSSRGRVKNFLFCTSSRPVLGSTQPPFQWVPGAPSPGVKRPRREADYSSPTSAEVKKTWVYIFTPPYAFMA